MRTIRPGTLLRHGLILTGCLCIDAWAQSDASPIDPASTTQAAGAGDAAAPAVNGTARSAAPTIVSEYGIASYYAHRLTGRKTASGEIYDPNALTAAHRTLPLGTQVKVLNPQNDRSVVVTVNDRGPTPKHRVIDVSSAAAEQLGMKRAGVARVETQVVGKTAASATPGSDAPGSGPDVH